MTTLALPAALANPGMMYPYWHTRTIHDGLVSEGESDVVMLTRSAWAGMQRWGAALWSGDTSSHFGSLKVSIQAGLNTQMSGIAWWTTAWAWGKKKNTKQNTNKERETQTQFPSRKQKKGGKRRSYLTGLWGFPLQNTQPFLRF